MSGLRRKRTMEGSTCSQCGKLNRDAARYCGACGSLLSRPIPDHDIRRALPLLLGSGTLLGAEGRYRIDRRLGAGGFSQVFLAEDTRLNRLCVIKQLRIDPAWDADSLRRVSRAFAGEARMLADLNAPGHPHIPDVYDHLDDQLCLVMQHVQGESLHDLLARRATPLPEEEALRYIRDACAALAYLHARTPPILHRDIKPANLIIDRSGHATLIDFGLAQPAPSSQHSGPIALPYAGTQGYAPPEQLEGAPEARSDIYALGATLYHLLTRRPPAPPAGGPPPPIRSLNPAVRPELEALLARALAPLAADRPAAAELLDAIETLLGLRELPPPEPESPPMLAEPLGREEVIAELERQLDAARVVALVGMPGVGKTALARAVARRSPTAAPAFWHTFQIGEGGDTLLWLLAGWLAHAGRPELWRRLLAAQQPGGQPIAPDLVADYLAQQLRGRGGLLCLDDLHNVGDDPATLRVIARLADAARRGGPALLITARTLPATLRPRFTLALGGLAPADARALLAQSGLDLPGPLLDRVATLTEGNPQLLTLAGEILRRTADPTDRLARLAESSDIGGYLLREVDAGLAAPERRVMEAVAALQGYGGTRAAIEALLGGRSAWRVVTQLCERHLLIVEPRSTGPIYRQHALVQSFYYTTLSARRRRDLHARAGAYYAGEADHPLAAARHFAHAGQPEQTGAILTRELWRLIRQGEARAARDLLADLPVARLDPALRAATHAAHGEILVILGDNTAAQVALDRSLHTGAAVSTPVQQARCHRLLAQIYERTGRYAEAEASCRAGLALADTSGPVRSETARLYSQLAEVLMRRNAFEPAIAAAQAGLAVLPPAPANPGERGALLQRLATIEGRRGAYTTAIGELEQSLELARQAGDPALTAAVLHNLGHYHQLSGAIGQAMTYYTESLHLAEQIGDLSRRLSTLDSLGWVLMDQGEHAAAQHHLEECRALSEQHNLAEHGVDALINLGQLYLNRAEFAGASERLRQAHAITGRLGIHDKTAHCHYLLGDIALRMGDPAAAEEHGRLALALADRIDSPVYRSCALRVRGEARLAQGDLIAAAADLAEAARLQGPIGDPYDQALIDAALAQLAQAQGDHTRARALAASALSVAHKRGISYLADELTALLGRS